MYLWKFLEIIWACFTLREKKETNQFLIWIKHNWLPEEAKSLAELKQKL